MPLEPHFLLSFHLIITSDGDDDGGDGDGDGGTIHGCERYARMSNLDYDVNDNAYFIGVSSSQG